MFISLNAETALVIPDIPKQICSLFLRMKKTIVLFFLFMLFASFACLAEEGAGKKPSDMLGGGIDKRFCL